MRPEFVSPALTPWALLHPSLEVLPSHPQVSPTQHKSAFQALIHPRTVPCFSFPHVRALEGVQGTACHSLSSRSFILLGLTWKLMLCSLVSLGWQWVPWQRLQPFLRPYHIICLYVSALMEGESSAFFTLECKHGGAGVLPCGDEAALAKYPGVGS